MPLLVSDALVLHAFDYLESSRILRLVTREGGVRSVLARGVRRSSRRFGSALDLFARGTAQLHTKPGRELDTLGGFEVSHSYHELASDLARFTGASMLSELTLRFGGEAADEGVFDAVVQAIGQIAAAPPEAVREVALAGAWRLVSQLGVAPSLDECASCHSAIPRDDTAMFSHTAGGALCRSCARLAVAGRVLPPAARDVLRTWLGSERLDSPRELDAAAGKAHQRLLREFLQEHLADARPLRAFEVWEHESWSAT